jgi:hypothetical protein
MLDAIKRWISGGAHGPDWSEVSGWAQKHGHGFKRARDDEGFVIDGAMGDKPWRLEWGPPQRSYIGARELRIRMELGLSSNLQMLLLSRLLMEMLERETFERYTKSNQTLIDVSTPEEMRWLAMFPKVDLGEQPKELRNRFAAVASDPQTALQWLEPAFSQRLNEAAVRLLRQDPPFVLMTLRGRLYLRLECALPEPLAISQSVALFEAAAQAALHITGQAVKESADWPTTSSTAWHTLHPEDPKG